MRVVSRGDDSSNETGAKQTRSYLWLRCIGIYYHFLPCRVRQANVALQRRCGSPTGPSLRPGPPLGRSVLSRCARCIPPIISVRLVWTTPGVFYASSSLALNLRQGKVGWLSSFPKTASKVRTRSQNRDSLPYTVLRHARRSNQQCSRAIHL